jgi:hypothetical protein
MLSFCVVNLVIPGDPVKLDLALPSGTWTLERHPNYAEFKQAIGEGKCAETYFLEHPVDLRVDKSAAVDRAFDEITPILLAASFLTGMSVTIKRSTPQSDVMIVQSTDHWPRERAIHGASPIITTDAEFKQKVEQFMQAWPQAGRTEKARLLVHHWLDALACWSMEDLYLSATTLLQIIVATEADHQGKAKLDYYPGVTDASTRMGIPALSNDFKNMRNELIHDGQLIGRRFLGPDKLACAAVVAEVLNWFDLYVFTALGMGAPAKPRFSNTEFVGLNAYSIN